jgi:hypothetical protein
MPSGMGAVRGFLANVRGRLKMNKFHLDLDFFTDRSRTGTPMAVTGRDGLP